MPEWVLVRHGETRWNAERRVQGQTDVPLHDPGRRQIERTAARLASRAFARVYASDLVRVRETAEIIIAASESGPPELCVDPALREVAFGDFEGMTDTEIRGVVGIPLFFAGMRDLDFRPPGGESYRELLDRSGPFAESLFREHSGDDVLVVGHGAALRALAVRLLGLPYDAYWALGGLDSGSISAVRLRNGHPSLAAWNDTGHLR